MSTREAWQSRGKVIQVYVNFEILISNLRTRTVHSTEIHFGNLKRREYRTDESEVVEGSRSGE